jgi:hypothetical protein
MNKLATRKYFTVDRWMDFEFVNAGHAVRASSDGEPNGFRCVLPTAIRSSALIHIEAR